MTSAQTILLAQRWLSLPWKAYVHSYKLVHLLHRVCENERDDMIKYESNRLMQRVMVIGDDVWNSCVDNPNGFSRVAFMPVAVYDDESGCVTMPSDPIEYVSANKKERNIQQFSKAVNDWNNLLSELSLTIEDLK